MADSGRLQRGRANRWRRRLNVRRPWVTGPWELRGTCRRGDSGPRPGILRNINHTGG